MADRHLGQVRQRAKHDEVVQIEIVPGIHAESEGMRALAALDVRGEQRSPARRIFRERRANGPV